MIGDARSLPFPPGLMLGVVLMRHCRHLALYWEKLAAAGATGLITNARWRLAPELIELDAPRRPYAEAPPGWYACHCGAVGFVEGSADQLSDSRLDMVCEVVACPACRQAQGRWGVSRADPPVAYSRRPPPKTSTRLPARRASFSIFNPLVTRR